MNSNAHWKERIALLSVLALTTTLFLRKLTDPSLGYSDADRLLMDGVFILDFLRDFPITRIYDYTLSYFVQYPALSIGYRPPFFPFVEAIFNGVFGINIWSSRLAIAAFALVGVTAWFKLIQRIYDVNTAWWATILLVSTPFVARWSWYTMSEIPVLSMALLTAYLFHRFSETDAPRDLYLTAISFSLTVWTKQPAVFLSLWFILYAAFNGRLLEYLRRKETWIASLLILVLLVPLAVITLWLGHQNVEQSVGAVVTSATISRLSWDNLQIHIYTLGRDQLTLPVLILSLIGMASAIIKRDRKSLFFFLLIVSTYVFFTYLAGKSQRYSIFWLPAFTFFAALPISYLRNSTKLSTAMMLILGVTTVYQISKVYSIVPNYATAYDEAARYVLASSTTPTVFFDGYNNGYFTYFMRAFDAQRSMYVLRGDKLLTSSSIHAQMDLQVHASSTADIQKIFDDYGVVYIVIESDDRSGIPVHQQLRDFLSSGPFRMVKEFRVESNRDMLEGQKLLVYRYLAAKPVTADHIELRLPVVGKTIKVPMRYPEHARALELSEHGAAPAHVQ